MTQFNYCYTKKPNGCYIQIVRIVKPDDDPDISYLAQEEGFENRLTAYENGDFDLLHIAAEARCMIVTNGTGILINIRSPGRNGVESDSGEDYLDELYQDEVATLKHMLSALANPVFEEEAPTK